MKRSRATCHPDRWQHGRGLCNACYAAVTRDRAAHAAYNRAWNTANRERRNAHQRAYMAAKKAFL